MSVLHDSSLEGNDGSYDPDDTGGVATVVPGIVGGDDAASITASSGNSLASAPVTPGFLAGDFWICGWFAVGPTEGISLRYVSMENADEVLCLTASFPDGDDRAFRLFRRWGDGESDYGDAVGETLAPSLSWHLGTITYELATGTIKFYFDGELNQTLDAFDATPSTVEPATAFIGNSVSSETKAYDEVAWGPGLPTDDDIADLFAAYNDLEAYSDLLLALGAHGSETGSVALVDSSGEENDGLYGVAGDQSGLTFGQTGIVADGRSVRSFGLFPLGTVPVTPGLGVGDFTVGGWCGTTDGNSNILFGLGTVEDSSNWIVGLFDNSGPGSPLLELRRTATGIDTDSFAAADGPVAAGPHMWVIVYEDAAGTATFYLDGELYDTVSNDPATMEHEINVALLGAGPSGPAIEFDEIMFIPAVVDGADIAALYALVGDGDAYTAAVLALDPTGYYHLDESPGGPTGYYHLDDFVADPPDDDPPVVDSVDPNEGPTAGGTEVTITGSNLTPCIEVNFGGVAAASFFDDESGTTVTAVTPAHVAGTVQVTVATPVGTSGGA